MSHRKHSKASELFRSVEHNRRESAGHFWIQTYFNTSLYLALWFNEEIQHLFCVDDGLSKVCHQSDESGVPFIRYFCESCWSAGHQNLSNSVFESFEWVFIESNEGICCDFLCNLILKLPNSFLLSKLLFERTDSWKNPHFKSTHRKEKIGIISGVNWNKSVFPVNGRNASWKSIFNLPKDTSSKIDVVFHQSHPTILWPTLLIIVANYILVVWIRIFSQIPLN